MVKAECHSDDFVEKADFDATAWFEQASDAQVVALAGIGWRGDVAADEVAEYFEHKPGFEEVAAMFAYLSDRPRTADGDPVGFECVVDPDSAMEWLEANRPALHERVVALTGYDPVPEMPTP